VIKDFAPYNWKFTWAILTCQKCGSAISINRWSDDGGDAVEFEEGETIAHILKETQPHRCADQPVRDHFEEEAMAYNKIMSNQTYLDEL
jgi:hypothetical protein